MSDIVFGPFERIEAPHQQIPKIAVVGGRPRMVWNGEADTELWLPTGWFYEFTPGASGRSHQRLTFWCAGGGTGEIIYDGYYLHLMLPGFEQAAPIEMPAGLEVIVETAAPSVFPEEALVLADDPGVSDCPRVVCTPRWLTAVDLARSVTKKSAMLGNQGEKLLECRTALPNGSYVESTLVARSMTDTSGGAPKLGVWPSFVRPGWRLHRLYADAVISRRKKEDASDMVTEITLVAVERLGEIRTLQPMRSLDNSTSVAISTPSKMGAPAVQSALLLDAPAKTEEIFWSVSEFHQGQNNTSMRAALFSSGVTTETPAWGKRTLSGATEIGLDLGTTTTTVSGIRDTRPSAFCINKAEPQWALAWAGGKSAAALVTAYHWLPWISSVKTEVRDQGRREWEQFPSAIRVTVSQPGCAPDTSISILGARVSSGLVRAFEADWPALTGRETNLQVGANFRSKPGGIKWDSLRNPVYKALREIYLEQLLTFVAHDIRELGGAGGSNNVILRATCPSRFSKIARENFAEALLNVAETVLANTGLKIEVGGREGNAPKELRAEAAAATLRDESEPLLRQVVSKALLQDKAALVLVADMGGETLDLGLYARLDNNTFAEIFSDSIRCGGHGALKLALPEASRENTTQKEILSFAIREHGAKVLNYSPELPEYARQDLDSVFSSKSERDNAKVHFQSHAIAGARAAASLLAEAAEQITALAGNADSTEFRLDQFQFAHTKGIEIGDAQFRANWINYSEGEWEHLRPRLAKFLSQPPQAAPTAAAPIATAASPTQPVAGSQAEALKKLRQLLVDRIEEAELTGEAPTVHAKLILKRLDDALAAPGALETPAAPAPVAAPAAAPAASAPTAANAGPLQAQMIVYLAGNGWSLAEAAEWSGAAVLMEEVFRVLGIGKCRIISGSKVDAVVGLLQAQNTTVWRRYGGSRKTDRLQPLMPHGVSLSSFGPSEPTVYHGATLAEFRSLVVEALDSPKGDLFKEARELVNISNKTVGHSDTTGIVSSVAAALGAAQGTATRKRIRAWAESMTADEGIEGPAQKIMLEALYSQDA